MIDIVLLTLIITTSANLLISIFSHVKKSSCYGISIETDNKIPEKVNLERRATIA